MTSRSSERAEEVAAAYAIGIGCDLLAADGAARLFGESTKRVGKIDILVLNGPGPAPGTAAATLLDVAVAADGGPRFESARWELQGFGSYAERAHKRHPTPVAADAAWQSISRRYRSFLQNARVALRFVNGTLRNHRDSAECCATARIADLHI